MKLSRDTRESNYQFIERQENADKILAEKTDSLNKLYGYRYSATYLKKIEDAVNCWHQRIAEYIVKNKERFIAEASRTPEPLQIKIASALTKDSAAPIPADNPKMPAKQTTPVISRFDSLSKLEYVFSAANQVVRATSQELRFRNIEQDSLDELFKNRVTKALYDSFKTQVSSSLSALKSMHSIYFF